MPRRLNVALCLLAFVFAGCKPSYPKKDLIGSVRDLFRKELGVEVDTQLSGRTIYVAFEIEKLVTKNLELPKDATDKLESAMLSISRIALSTDADIKYTVIEANDFALGIRIELVRKMQDLKDLFYWKISKPDFDERLILEVVKISDDYGRSAVSSAPSRGAADVFAGEKSLWHDLSLPEFMGRLVASRINMGVRTNPFLSILLGVEKVIPRFDEDGKTLYLAVESYSKPKGVADSSIAMDFLSDTIKEQMSRIGAKYEDPEWAKSVVVQDLDGRALLEIKRDDWINAGEKHAGNVIRNIKIRSENKTVNDRR